MASTDRSFLARIFSPGPARENHPASGPTGKAGRNLPQAITTAVVLIAAVAVPLFTSLPAFVGVIAFVCLVGIWELAGEMCIRDRTLSDAWVWDIYRSSRFVRSVRVITYKDVNVEELSKPELDIP